MSANNLHKTTRKALWLVIFLFSLFCQGQNANAQFGLFDTVWTMKGLPQDYEIRISPNDSLFLLWTREEPQSGVEYTQRTRLFHTLTKNQIWDTTGITFPAILSDNKTVISWDSNKIILRDLLTLEPLNTVIHQNVPINGAKYYWQGISEIDTSQYISGYINYTDLKAVSKKFNYKTGQTTITSDSLPYFAMTISEDGQYVAGVYYTGGQGTNVPYKEILEVRKISDYSLVFRNESKYSDWTPSITPYQWVTNYKFKFSKDNKYLILHMNYAVFSLYDISNKILLINNKTAEAFSCKSFSKDSKYLYYQCKIKNGIFENHIVHLESMIDRFIQNEPELPTLVGGSEGLILNDAFLLSAEGIATYDSSYTKLKLLGNIGLARLNFDLTSIQEPEISIQGTLYPNPTTDYINIDLSFLRMKESAINIFDVFGNCVLNVETIHELSLQRIDVSALPAGVYFVRIGNEKPQKFIVVR